MEIYRSGSWEAVCLDEWDLNDAFVACRQLGYPGADRIIPENGTNIGVSLKNVHCNGHEDTLGDCIQDWSLENCNYGHAGVVCSGKFQLFLFILLSSFYCPWDFFPIFYLIRESFLPIE